MVKRINMEHKYEYVRGKKQGCFLCLAASGEIDDLVLYRDDLGVIILNKYPYNTGHLLIAPRRHVSSVEELEEAEALRLFKAIRASMKAIREAFNPQGFNIGINIGRAAGASQEHLHIHLVPRRYGEYNFMETIVGSRSVLINPERVQEMLKGRIKL